MRTAALLILSTALGGCLSAPSPGLSLQQARVGEGPILIERSGHVYLRYRRALEVKGPTLVSVLHHKKTADAVYYFFSTPISHIEWGNLIERPLAYDGTEEFARKGKIYWLDPDGSRHAILLGSEESNGLRK
jgi:hypothetical protein